MEYTRVVAANSDVSKELKKSSIFDSKFAYANYLDGGAVATHLYPKIGGCGAWINALIKKYEHENGYLLTGKGIAEVNPRYCNATLNDGNKIVYKHLVWTAPIGLLAKLIFPQVQITIPNFVPTALYHFRLSNKPLCDCHYVYINDPNMKSFRVTLYPNITDDNNDCRVTIEAIEKSSSINSSLILGELIKANLFSPNTTILSESFEFLPNGFPEITLLNLKENADVRNKIASYDNILIGGRGGSDVFFMNDVLKAIASELEFKVGSLD